MKTPGHASPSGNIQDIKKRALLILIYDAAVFSLFDDHPQ